MLSIKNWTKQIVLILISLSCLIEVGEAFSLFEHFISGLSWSEGVKAKMFAGLGKGKEAFVFMDDTGIFSLYATKIPEEKDTEMLRELELSSIQRSNMHARRNLLIELTKKSLAADKYSYREALGSALETYYARTGSLRIQSKSDYYDGWAFSAVWILGKIAENKDVPQDEIYPDYCSVLYQQAKELFEAENYSGALLVFEHIHNFKWANISMYLDTAECFLKVSGEKDAEKLLQELVSVCGDDMTSDELARVGRLFRASGNKEAARESFLLARQRFKAE